MASAQRFSIRSAGSDVSTTAMLDHGAVTIEGIDSTFRVERAADGCYLVSDGSRIWRVFVAGPAEARQVWVDGLVAELEVISDHAPRKRRRASHGDLTAAPMPATVLQVLVGVGQAVSQGDVVLKLEAMKMELPIRASKSGTVTALHCQTGDLVQPGVPLIDIS